VVDGGPPSLGERLEAAIERTRRLSPVRSLTVTRRDGLVIVHHVAPGQDPRLAAAMAAATVGGAASAAQELHQGAVERVIIECSAGKMIAIGAGPEAIVLALYDREANLGLVLHELTRAAQAIDQILEQYG